MAEEKKAPSKVSYPGHDEGSTGPKNAPAGYKSPAAFTELNPNTPSSVNQKTGYDSSQGGGKKG